MKCLRLVARRYQLKKEAARIVERGHPWIFRSHLSKAADVFNDGSWLTLVGPNNKVIGSGIYSREGLIAIRVLKTGEQGFDLSDIRKRVSAALRRRENLRIYTDY